ncbi:Eco57I restriction-modification methylase domain-containing protein [Clostridium scatologenes]|uniref:site-specific DNA-methyltransferase (adenine-specific) n=1 Tax=Clostridium scatologenes TaxID=1548 RepID=A0A0E3JR70_CLOSL|nr:Eco57I restriction-modification methylase domain-containing protein [Clostridium scatologenes]AKA71492.1 modification methylase BsuBI [Clostridium scatologenes]
MDIYEQKILNLIASETEKYLKSIDIDTRKKESQFFTSYEVAVKMSKLMDLKKYKSVNDVKILEPSAGFGILIYAVSLMITKKTKINRIDLTLFEKDEIICRSLNKIMERIKDYLNIYKCNLQYRIINKDFILFNKDAWNNNNLNEVDRYDLIVSNPPYKKINKSDVKSLIMSDIITDQPNLYHLFIALSLKFLKINGEYIALTPRNYLVGKYTIRLRQWILENYSITNLHSFDSRNLFKEVNQEVIITKFSNNRQNKVKVSYNSTSKFITSIRKLIFEKDKYMILLPTNKESLNIVNVFKKKGKKLCDLGINCIVGPIVQFRNLEYLSKVKNNETNIPFLILSDLKDNSIIFNTREKKYKYVSNKISSRLTENTNGVLLRKVTAKDDKEIIVGAVLNKDFFNTDFIGLDSNIIFFKGVDREMSIEECYGLYAFLVSDYFSQYYLLISGTHTINMFELNSMYFPRTNYLINIGSKVIIQKQLNKKLINELINEYLLIT